MLILNTTSKTITAVMSGAAATVNPNFVTAYADNDGTTFTEGASDGTLNGTSVVTLISSPASSTRRTIKSIYIENTDSAVTTITLGYFNGTSTRTIAKVTLNPGDTWTTEGTYDTQGQIKYVVGTSGTTTNSLTAGTGLSGGSFNGSAATTFALANTAVTPGSYTNANVTVDQQGRITLASNGTAGGVTSITGTASQITASASTGAVTLSLPSTINVNTSGNAATATSATSATSATTATNIAGGSNLQIPYNTGSGATSFITVPTDGTYLKYNTSGGFTWAAGGGGGGGGTVTSVAATVPTFLSVSGSPITTSGTLAISYSGTALPLANGGTGQTTAQASMNTFAGAVTSGSYLRGNGTNVVMSTIQAVDVPTLNQNTTGTAANVTATSNNTLTTLSALSLPNTQVSGLGTMSTQNATAVAVTGGTINGTSIGATTRSTGDFTTLSANTVTSTTPVLSFNASNSIASFGSTTTNSFNQLVIQNKSGTTGASTNYVVSNDLGTDSTYYGEFGMNASTYSSGTPADFFSLNNGIYFSGHDGDVSIGSGNGKNLYLAWGTTGQSAHVINASGAIGLNTNITGTTNFGTAGQVLTSAGSGATPTWTTVSGGGGGTPGGSSGQIQYNNSGSFGGITNITVPSGQTAAKVLPRVSAVSAISTVAFNTDNYDFYIITAQSAALTFNNTTVTGTPSNGQRIWISVTGTAAVSLTFGTGFEASGTVPLPTTTQGTVRLDIGFVWNAATSAWRCIASA